jgi:hypothetical protein
LALFFGSFVHGQTAAEMDALLDTGEITWDQAGSGAAFALALERGWLPGKAAADSPATLGGLSFLISNAFSIQNSLLYAPFPGPRYAYRQLDYLGLVPGLRYPAMNVSGERLIQILGRVLDSKPGRIPKNPPFGGGASGRIFKPANDGGVETRQCNKFPCERRYLALQGGERHYRGDGEPEAVVEPVPEARNGLNR